MPQKMSWRLWAPLIGARWGWTLSCTVWDPKAQFFMAITHNKPFRKQSQPCNSSSSSSGSTSILLREKLPWCRSLLWVCWCILLLATMCVGHCPESNCSHCAGFCPTLTLQQVLQPTGWRPVFGKIRWASQRPKTSCHTHICLFELEVRFDADSDGRRAQLIFPCHLHEIHPRKIT